MSDYTKTTDFAVKDGLSSGNASKVIVGTEFDDEFNNIATAVNTKYDSADRGVANGIASLDSSALVPAAQMPIATTTAIGALEIATVAEAQALTAADKILTPDLLDEVLTDNGGVLKDVHGLTDPGADRIGFWDDSAGAFTWLTVSTGLSLTGTDLTTNDAAILHDSLSGFVANEHIDHSGVSITAGSALTGGGTIAATRTIDFNMSSLSSLDSSTVAAVDTFIIDDGAGGTNARIAWQDIGPRIVASSTKSLALTDGNSINFNSTGVDHTITVDPEGTTAYNDGHQTGFFCKSTGTITIAEGTGVTVTSLNGNLTVKASGGGAYLVKLGTNDWALIGDLEA